MQGEPVSEFQCSSPDEGEDLSLASKSVTGMSVSGVSDNHTVTLGVFRWPSGL